MGVGGFEAAGDVRVVAELPDLECGAEGEFGAAIGQCEAHGRFEGAVMRLEVAALVADHHEFAGLVGGDEEGGA